MYPILGAIIAAILTGLIGNWLVQGWQQRNWYAQQRQIGFQQQVQEITKLLEDITSAANKRLYLMKRLTWSLNDDDRDKFEANVKAYRDVLEEWNVKLPNYYNQLRILISYEHTSFLENIVQDGFVKSGSMIQACIRSKRAGRVILRNEISDINNKLNLLSASLRNFLLPLTDIINDKNDILRYGKKIRYTDGLFSEFSTIYLFKALFVRDIFALNIVRPA